MDQQMLIRAATRRWESLAAFAWTSSRSGPGAVVLHAEDLMADREVVLNWFAASDVPAGDDFRGLMLQCDMERDVMLIIVTESGDFALVLQADDTKPSPEECARRERGSVT